MRQFLKSGVARSFSTYFIGNVLQSALSFLLLPLYMARLSPAEYGAVSTIQVVYMFAGMIGGAGLLSAMQKTYFEKSVDRRRVVLGAVLAWHGLIGGLILTISILLASTLSAVLFGSSAFAGELRLAGIAFVLGFFQDILLNKLRLEDKPTAYVSLTLLRFGFELSAKVLFVLILRRGVAGYFEAQAIANATIFLAVVVFALRENWFHVESDEMRTLLRLGWPFVIAGLAGWVLQFSDRIMVTKLADVAETGIYSAGLRFSSIFSIVVVSPVSTMLPSYVFRFHGEHQWEETTGFLKRIMSLLVVVGLSAGLIVSVLSKGLLQLISLYREIDRSYFEAARFIPASVISLVWRLWNVPASYYLLLIEKPIYSARAAAVAAVSNIGFNFLLIPLLGAEGAAVATAFSQMILTLIVHNRARQQGHALVAGRTIALSILSMAVSYLALRQLWRI